MNLQSMQPTPLTASGETFKVTCCKCGAAVKSTDVLCDLDGKAGDYYCPSPCAIEAEMDYKGSISCETSYHRNQGSKDA